MDNREILELFSDLKVPFAPDTERYSMLTAHPPGTPVAADREIASFEKALVTRFLLSGDPTLGRR